MSKFALAFILLFFGGLAAALIHSPVYAVMLYQLVYFMNPEIRWWGASIPNIPYSFITVLVMMLALGLNYKKAWVGNKITEHPSIKWVLVILLLYYFMCFFAVVPGLHYKFTYDFTKLIIIFIIVYKVVDSERSFDIVVLSYVVGAAYIGYVAGVSGRDETGRVENIGMIDTGGDSNMTAAALVPAVVILMYYFWLGSRKIKLLSLICGVLIVNGLILINSRGAFLGVIAGASLFLLYMIFSKHQRKGQRFSAISVIFFGVLGAYSLTDKYFWMRMSTLKQVEDGDASGSHRVDFWLATFDVMKDFPLGVGINGFEAVSTIYLPSKYFVHISNKAVHSSWFQLLAETGWPGPIIFFILLFSLFRLAKKTKQYSIDNCLIECYFKIIVFESALLSYLVAATFINRIRAESMWWCILFLMIATNVYYLKKVGPAGAIKSGQAGVDNLGNKNNALS